MDKSKKIKGKDKDKKVQLNIRLSQQHVRRKGGEAMEDIVIKFRRALYERADGEILSNYGL